MAVLNPFEVETEAERYHKYRPRYHHIPFQEIGAFVGRLFERSLDVACGTGHSTLALAQISKTTIGCDLSEAMLREARKVPGISFVQAPAEKLPFEDASFDFINISMGFHWLDQKQFLDEAKRLLQDQGFLSIDSYGFTGKMSEDPDKQKAHTELFSKYLPRASKNPIYPSQELCEGVGLSLVKEIKYDHQVSLTAQDFINLITTWSNFLILDEEQQSQVLEKMQAVYSSIFGSSELELEFGGEARLYRF